MENLIKIFIGSGFRYFLFAGLPFLFFYILKREKYEKNKIQKRISTTKQFLKEVQHSLSSLVILTLVISLTLFSPIRDISQIYIDIDAYPIWWLPLSVLLGMVIHDTYFYWLHRTFHQKHVYRFIHKVHHQSINPSPWASYSFDLLEAFAESFILIILVLILPFHPIALIIFGLLSFAINVYGHLGYEIMPKRFRTSILFQIFATSVYHNMHHRKFHGNYGLYFRIWDRLLGTEHPDYIKAYDDIQNRRFGK